MSEATATYQPARQSALALMAGKLSVEPAKLLGTLKATVFKGATDEELLALVVVSNTYGLNPLLKEIYAFPAKGGGIAPIVSIDGWIRMTNDHAMFDGMELDVTFQDGRPDSATCKIHRKDRTRPTVITEYFSECARNTEPWKQFPARMLRHKALIQCARIAFGFSGIQDEDEAKDAMRNVTPAAAAPVMQAGPALVSPTLPAETPQPVADASDADPQPEPPQADEKAERMAAIRRIQTIAKSYGIQPADMVPGLVHRQIVPEGTNANAIPKLPLATLAEIEAAAESVCQNAKDAKGGQAE